MYLYASPLLHHCLRNNSMELGFQKCIYMHGVKTGSQGNSVSIVSEDTTDWTTGRLRFNRQQRKRIFPVASVTRAHPASCPMGTGGPFPRAKARPQSDADHSPHLVPRSRMSRRSISSPPKGLHGV
jgi:hypothetical protein